MTKLVLLLGLFLIVQFTTTHQQQQVCRVVSICDGKQLGTDPLLTTPDPRGDSGGRGLSPDREELVAMITSLSDRVEQISAQLNETSNKLDKLYLDVSSPATTNIPPESCNTSKVQGRQFLSSGDEVYCEDGWLVFQNRYDGSVSFDRGWVDYKSGFGNLSSEFWLGLDKLHQYTAASTTCRLRVNIWDYSDGHAYADYSNFSVGDEGSFYRLTIGGYCGTAGDSLTLANQYLNVNGMKFTTRDKDNDRWSSGNCAGKYGGWWYHSCGYCSLNGLWVSQPTARLYTMSWVEWEGRYGGIKGSKMKVKCY